METVDERSAEAGIERLQQQTHPRGALQTQHIRERRGSKEEQQVSAASTHRRTVCSYGKAYGYVWSGVPFCLIYAEPAFSACLWLWQEGLPLLEGWSLLSEEAAEGYVPQQR